MSIADLSAISLRLSSRSLSKPQSAVSIKSLSLPHGVLAPDIFGKPKSQPVHLSIALQLNHGTTFSSADKLDHSTIHYGHLAKAIRAASRENQSLEELETALCGVIEDMGMKAPGKFVVAQATVEVCLPKASLFGEGVTMVMSTRYDGGGRVTGVDRVFGLQSLKIMTLIGVNSYERELKQPLVASLMLHVSSEARSIKSEQMAALFSLEQLLVEAIQETAYETLETLSEFVVSQLREEVLDRVLAGCRVQLLIEKPRAIAFADAPAIEIIRQVPEKRGDDAQALSTEVHGIATSFQGLSIVKPYSS